jgi:hypothetical protein
LKLKRNWIVRVGFFHRARLPFSSDFHQLTGKTEGRPPLPSFSMESDLWDMACLSRHERQAVYGDILKANGGFMSPGQVKADLERQGMTFVFVGQDMEAMRLMPCIKIGERGQYQWNAAFSGKRNRPASSLLPFSGELKKLKVGEEDGMNALLAAIDAVEGTRYTT